MCLVVGLGNPGPRYEINRHNVGFLVLRELAPAEPGWSSGFGGRVARMELEGRPIVLLEPHTYMNHSGRSVAAALEHFGFALNEVLVVHDDLDLPLGRLRLKRAGGTGGHNGLKSIVAECGGRDFDRLRVGIGRPEEGSIVDWVLGDFPASEGAALDDVLQDATRVLAAAVAQGTIRAMNSVNAREKPEIETPSSLPADPLGAIDQEDS